MKRRKVDDQKLRESTIHLGQHVDSDGIISSNLYRLGRLVALLEKPHCRNTQSRMPELPSAVPP